MEKGSHVEKSRNSKNEKVIQFLLSGQLFDQTLSTFLFDKGWLKRWQLKRNYVTFVLTSLCFFMLYLNLTPLRNYFKFVLLSSKYICVCFCVCTYVCRSMTGKSYKKHFVQFSSIFYRVSLFFYLPFIKHSILISLRAQRFELASGFHARFVD